MLAVLLALVLGAIGGGAAGWASYDAQQDRARERSDVRLVVSDGNWEATGNGAVTLRTTLQNLGAQAVDVNRLELGGAAVASNDTTSWLPAGASVEVPLSFRPECQGSARSAGPDRC